MKKRIISLLLTIAITLSFSSVSFAIAQKDEKENNCVITPISSNDGHLWTIRGEYLSNGNFNLYLTKDGQIIANSFVDQEKHTITTTDKLSQEAEVASFTPAQQLRQAASSSFFKVGWIDYSHTGGTDIRRAEIAYASTFTNVHYDIHGQFKNILSVTSLLVAVLFLPQSVASTVAARIATYLGIGLGAVNFVIPSCLVDAQQHEMTWRAMFTTPTGPYSEVTGYKYVVTQPGYTGTYYSGPYYAASAFTNKNTVLAKALYDNAFWTYDESYGTPVKWTMINSLY